MTALTPNEKLRMTALALCESLRHWHDGKLEYDSAEHEALENALKEKDRFDSAYHIPGLLLLIENQQEEIERLRKALVQVYAVSREHAMYDVFRGFDKMQAIAKAALGANNVQDQS